MRVMLAVRHAIIGCAALMSALPTHAGQPDANGPVLAKFVDRAAAASRIEFPEVDGEVSAYVYCVALIVQKGKVRRSQCLEDQNFDDAAFRRAVEESVESMQFTPAVVDGRVRHAELHFRVYFSNAGGEAEIRIYPNWGNDADRYGPEYEAPQRYNVHYPGGCHSDYSIWSVAVDVTGRTTGRPSVYADRDWMQYCSRHLEEFMRNFQYIPARAEGRAVPATHVETWGNPVLEQVTSDEQGTTTDTPP